MKGEGDGKEGRGTVSIGNSERYNCMMSTQLAILSVCTLLCLWSSFFVRELQLFL